MKACCVVGCQGPATPDPVFFEFPSSRLLRKRWLDAINRPSAEDGARVCIRHFTRADYELVRGAATLRSRSVPSRRIGESDDEDSESGSDSSESTASDRTQDSNNAKIETNNGKINNDNENNGQINNDNGINEKDRENSKSVNQKENGPMNDDSSSTEKVNTENNSNRLDNENNEKINKDKEKINDDNGKVNNEDEKVNNDSEKVNKEDGTLNNDGTTNNDSENVNKEDGTTNNDNEKVNKEDGTLNNDGTTNNDNEKVINDNGTVNNDNGNNLKKVTGRKTRCKITALRAINGRRKFSFSSDSTNSDSVSSSPRRPDLEASKEDIEESLQHYYIENKKTERQVAAMTDVIREPQEKAPEETEAQKDKSEVEGSEPVFIELEVGRGSAAEGQEATEGDCLMLLESVQCDVDPALLLAAREEEDESMEQVDLEDDDDDDEPEFVEKKKEDPISLLTSSDEDDVIIQEPKYDTVEVSSADTSEDDMPLVKLVKPSSKSSPPDAKKSKLSSKHTKNLITKLLWGRNDFYCVRCRFTTMNASEYTKHMAIHNTLPQSQHKIIQYCQDCGFATSSKHQIQKHKNKHKNEKRFKCQKCNYSAKHEMSLVYHMKTHKNSGLNEVELAICGTYDATGEKSEKSEKSKKSKSSERSRVSEDDKKYKCGSCGYKTNRRSDMRRHRRRIHGDDDDDDDDEYVP